MMLNLPPFFKKIKTAVFLKSNMQKQENLIGSFYVKKDINDKIFSCGEGTLLEGTIPHSFLESLNRQCHGLSVLFTLLSDNNHWCDFRISVTPAESVNTLTHLVTTYLIFTQILLSEVLAQTSYSCHLMHIKKGILSKELEGSEASCGKK